MINMEREIGETFEYKGIILRVEERAFCKDCYFNANYRSKCALQPFTKVTGYCEYLLRSDRKSVSFVKIK